MTDIVGYTKSYTEYKQEFDAEINKTADGFVRIGYLLKVARDTDILRESPYCSVVDFARGEYGIDKSQVSRFIAINDKFAVNGYSEELEDKYKGYGCAKLSLMLQLPGEVNDIITPDYSKSEIQAIKEEVDAEKQITDMEVMMEDKDAAVEQIESKLDKQMHQLLHDLPEVYKELHDGNKTVSSVKEQLAPGGNKVISIRISGMGRFMVSLTDDKVTIVDVRGGGSDIYNWNDIVKSIYTVMHITSIGAAAADWEKTYNEPFPKPQVAPVQQKAPEPAKVQNAKPSQTETKKADNKPKKKETKVVKAPVHNIPKVEKEPEIPENIPDELPGQKKIDDYPEYLPNEAEKEPEKDESTECEADSDNQNEFMNEPDPEEPEETPQDEEIPSEADKKIELIKKRLMVICNYVDCRNFDDAIDNMTVTLDMLKRLNEEIKDGQKA